MKKLFTQIIIFATLSVLFMNCLQVTAYATDPGTLVQEAQNEATGQGRAGAEEDDETKKKTETDGLTATGGTTFVADTGNAVQDILYLTGDGRDRFRGAISSIAFVTKFVDSWFIKIISIVAFFIIAAALLKNALAGAYVANTKFWDKVADAHAMADQISISSVGSYFSGGGFKSTSMGGVKNALLAIIPNIKAFTDFDSGDYEPKAYFMKAIPQMIACVVIGVFIYNGFYRDTAATVGDMGSVLLTRAFSSVSPESFVNKIFNSTSWPKFPQEADNSLQGQHELKLCEALKSNIISEFGDVGGSDNKSVIVTNIAVAVNQSMAAIQGNFYTNENVGYHYEISNIRVVSTTQDYITSMNMTEGTIIMSNGEGDDTTGVSDVACRVGYSYVGNLGLTEANESLNDTHNSHALVSFMMKVKNGDVQPQLAEALNVNAIKFAQRTQGETKTIPTTPGTDVNMTLQDIANEFGLSQDDYQVVPSGRGASNTGISFKMESSVRDFSIQFTPQPGKDVKAVTHKLSFTPEGSTLDK